MSWARIGPSGWAGAVLAASLVLATPAAAAPGDVADDPPGRLAPHPGPSGSTDQRGAADLVRPNPRLSLLPDPSAVDRYTWWTGSPQRSEARAEVSEQRAGSPRDDETPLVVEEEEPDAVRGLNDAPRTSQPVPGFGSRRAEVSAAHIRGTVAPWPAPVPFAAPPEDDGSIPLAGSTALGTGTVTRTTATIGDGPHGSAGDARGDVDFYAVRGAAGQRLAVSVDAEPGEGGLAPFVILWDAAGGPVAFGDAQPGELESDLLRPLPADGDYYVSVSDRASPPGTPFDPASGSGAAGEGRYTVTFGLDATEIDVYAVRLRAGDVLSGSVSGGGVRLATHAPDAGGVREVLGSSEDVSYLYPPSSPLTGGGNAVVDHVADVDGMHYVSTEGMSGDYAITLEVHRPGPDVRRARQTLFLDFDGARVNTGIWGGPGVRELSPFSAFVTAWGIPAWQEDVLIDQIVASATENLRRDFARTGVSVRVLNSRDHPDRFGRPEVSRVVVGGTIAEAGIFTIGIAQSIDPGNFELAETALVLLDVLSSSAEEPASLNAYLRPGSDRIRFVGTAIGNVVAHEAGHLVGSWHVDQFNAVANLMDAGGNYAQLFGVGPDGVGGTADDPDVDFGVDTHNPHEGFTGTENTAARTRWGLTS